MNITLAGNETRQHDLAMAMVGQAPEGARQYIVSTGELGVCFEAGEPRDCRVIRFEDDSCIVSLPAMSLEQARVHAAEVMASYMED